MAVSKYFRHTDYPSEGKLIDDLTVESIRIRGIDIWYIPREENYIDYLFGEDKQSSFTNYRIIEVAIPENVEGFGGEGDFMTRFGLDIRDECTFEMSKTRFTYEITRNYPSITRPREGDLIVFPLNKVIFEITFVEHEKPFYTVGETPTWEILTKRFEYSHEPMGTGDSDIDNIPNTPQVNDGDDLNTEDDNTPVSNWDETDPFSDHT